MRTGVNKHRCDSWQAENWSGVRIAYNSVSSSQRHDVGPRASIP